MVRRTPRIVVLAALTVVLAAPVARATELRFSKLSRVYQDLAGEMAPIEMPPVRIRLSSPSQTIVVKENRVELQPLGAGRFDGRVEIDLLGKGDLRVDLDLGGSSQHLEDEVLLPPQTVVVDGVTRIERATGGYRILPEKLPPDLRIEIRSRLINQVLDLCGGAAILSLGALDCGGLRDSLERPRIPLAGVAQGLFLADAELTDGERASLDRLLAAR